MTAGNVQIEMQDIPMKGYGHPVVLTPQGYSQVPQQPQVVVIEREAPAAPEEHRIRDKGFLALVFFVLGFFFCPFWCSGWWFSRGRSTFGRCLGMIMVTFVLLVALAYVLIGASVSLLAAVGFYLQQTGQLEFDCDELFNGDWTNVKFIILTN